MIFVLVRLLVVPINIQNFLEIQKVGLGIQQALEFATVIPLMDDV
ncbi:hypothetical protein ES703_123611 [subsurface metagenome]